MTATLLFCVILPIVNLRTCSISPTSTSKSTSPLCVGFREQLIRGEPGFGRLGDDQDVLREDLGDEAGEEATDERGVEGER